MIVDGVTVEPVPGGLLGLIGPNGSGKSSLLRLLARLRRTAGGVVTLDGADMAGLTQAAVARRVAFVEQQAATEAEVTVLDIVRLGRTPHRGPFSPWSATDEGAVDDALVRLGLDEKRHRLWHSLSGGERQRVQIARALAQCPSELLLDEPTNHLDIAHQLDLLGLLRRLPATCIVALHDLNLAAMFCDRIALLRDGQVVASGEPDKVLTEGTIRSVFGVRARVERSTHDGRLRIQYLPDESAPA
nr:ABC transporter ATP-binding protein [Azospirillum sp. SYSU D00513]